MSGNTVRCPHCGEILNSIIEDIQATVMRRIFIKNNEEDRQEFIDWEEREGDKGHIAYVCDYCLEELPEEVTKQIKGL